MIKIKYTIILIVITQASVAKGILLPDFTSLVEKTGAAVVNITARQNAVEENNPQSPRSNLERYFGIPNAPQSRDSLSGGSGFIISSDGYILTNRHVVHGADKIVVTMIDKREFDAELIGEDQASDIALLKVVATDLPFLKTGKIKDSKIGEWVIAIGSPLSFEHSVTKGIISAKGRRLGAQQYIPYIQTDVPINRGNSGGPLINMDAEVIGINTLILSNTGGYMGLSFSVPIDVAMSVVEQLKTTGSVKRGLLGVNIEPVNQKMANYLGLKTPHGALVNNVVKGSAADKAGIQIQDVIVEFNGQIVKTSDSLPPLVGSVYPGSEVKVSVIRDGNVKVIHAILGGLNNSDSILSIESPKNNGQLDIGFVVANILDDDKKQLEIDSGVVVKEITDREIERAELRVGDIILSMSKIAINNVTHFKELLSNLDEDEPIVLLIKQGAGKHFIVIERG